MVTAALLAAALTWAGPARAAIPGGTLDPDNGPPGTEVTLTTPCDLPPERQAVYLQPRTAGEVTEDPGDPRVVRIPLEAGTAPDGYRFVVPALADGEYWVHLECVPGQLFPMDSGEDLARRFTVTAGAPTPTPVPSAPVGSASPLDPAVIAFVGAAALAGLAVAVVLTRRRRPH